MVGLVMGAYVAIMYNICKEISTEKNKLVFPLIVIFAIFVLNTVCMTNYNTLAVMWVLIVVLIEVLKDKSGGGFKYNFLIRYFSRVSILYETKYRRFCSISNIYSDNGYKYMDNEEESCKRAFSKSKWFYLSDGYIYDIFFSD